eukprot:15388960-Alexandrium_andersonii.AAC.1
MSASLVGSEMCIRDRFAACALGEEDSRDPGAVREARVLLAPSGAGDGRSVSYTHLTLPTICSV